MATTNDINNCLSTYPNDSIGLTNCVRTSFGYPAVTATSSTTTSGCGTGIWDGCTAGISNKYLIVGGVGVILLYMISR